MSDLSPDQALALGLEHHHAGRPAEAEALFRQVLARQPQHPEALRLLGRIMLQTGRAAQAVDLLRLALRIDPNSVDAWTDLAAALEAQGQTAAVVDACQNALRLRPDRPDVFNNLGNALRALGRPAEAEQCFLQSLRLNPSHVEARIKLGALYESLGRYPEALAQYQSALPLAPQHPQLHFNRAVALTKMGRIEDAVAAFRQAIQLKPDYAEAYSNLGAFHQSRGQHQEAIANYRQALYLAPHHPVIHFNMGVSLAALGLYDQAIAAYLRALQLNPGLVEAHVNVGMLYGSQGHHQEALAHFQQALPLAPHQPAILYHAGVSLATLGRQDEAIIFYRQAIEQKPDYVEVYNDLATALHGLGRIDDAISAYQRALELKPDFVPATTNFANVLKSLSRHDEALVFYRRAITQAPDNAAVHSNLVYSLLFHPRLDTPAIRQELTVWNQRHATPLKRFIEPPTNDRNPDRRLRVGLVSPDFRNHPVGRFLLPLLTHHDRSQTELLAYADVAIPDALTQRLHAGSDGWRSILRLSDDRVAGLIRQDRIDILVDLAMHTASNRLLVFARKPAPLQITYLAYCASTGLDTIDYRLSDPFLDPPGMDESIYTERTFRLPHTYWCYQPVIPLIDAGSPPSRTNGNVTFGSLNNFCKVNEQVLALWARILRAVPESQFLLHTHEGRHRQRVCEQFQREGISPQRLKFVSFMPLETYFGLYRQIDIALDTFPYGGGTTTCDALWMGVPVVSLVTPGAVGRGGLSILSNVGLPELAAGTEDEYVRRAVDLAGDLPRLAELRASLRSRMEQSPLMDAPAFTRAFEAALRAMWRSRCASF